MDRTIGSQGLRGRGLLQLGKHLVKGAVQRESLWSPHGAVAAEESKPAAAIVVTYFAEVWAALPRPKAREPDSVASSPAVPHPRRQVQPKDLQTNSRARRGADDVAASQRIHQSHEGACEAPFVALRRGNSSAWPRKGSLSRVPLRWLSCSKAGSTSGSRPRRKTRDTQCESVCVQWKATPAPATCGGAEARTRTSAVSECELKCNTRRPRSRATKQCSRRGRSEISPRARPLRVCEFCSVLVRAAGHEGSGIYTGGIIKDEAFRLFVLNSLFEEQ